MSHFTTKNIAITNITRPKPVIVETDKVILVGTTRQRIAAKVGIDFTNWSGRKISKGNKSVKRIKKQKPLKITKLQVIQQQLEKESSYAAHPLRPRSELIERVIKFEAQLFRQHGRRKINEKVSRNRRRTDA